MDMGIFGGRSKIHIGSVATEDNGDRKTMTSFPVKFERSGAAAVPQIPNTKDRDLMLNLLNDLDFASISPVPSVDSVVPPTTTDHSSDSCSNSITNTKRQRSFFRVIFPFMNIGDDEDEITSNSSTKILEVSSIPMHKTVNDDPKTLNVRTTLPPPLISSTRRPCPVSPATTEDDSNSNIAKSPFSWPLLSDLSVVDSSPLTPRFQHNRDIINTRNSTNSVPPPQSILDQQQNKYLHNKQRRRNTPPTSILRNSSSQVSLSQSSNSSSIPSLASESNINITNTSDSNLCPQQKSSSCPTIMSTKQKDPPPPIRRERSLSMGVERTTKIKFDSRVGVCVFTKSSEDIKKLTWWSQKELASFKDEAMTRIKKQRLEYAAGCRGSATGRNNIYTPRAFYNHPAMVVGAADEVEIAKEEMAGLSSTHFKSVLIVDPHDIFLRLFSKSFKMMLPNVEVTTARSSGEALHLIEKKKNNDDDTTPLHGFDIIVTEERLQGHAHGRQYRQAPQDSTNSLPKTGSELLERLTLEEEKMKEAWRPTNSNSTCRFSLFVGVTAHSRDDNWKLQRSGADIVWGKPPPHMDRSLRDTLLVAICNKRGVFVNACT